MSKQITFAALIDCCLFEQPELLREYDRLCNTNLSKLASLSGQIDIATGKAEEDIGRFLWFVWDCIWLRLPPEIRG